MVQLHFTVTLGASCFYSTGREGLALNVSDICSDAKLGTLILDTYLELIVSICCD